MKFLTFLAPKQQSRPESSEFSRFFREASSREKKQVYLEVAKKASAEQRRVIESARTI